MGSGFSKMKKQARVMQEQYSKMQEELKNKRATGTSGNGLISLTLDGEHNLVGLKIKPECVDPSDIEGLEDLIRAAHKEAVAQLKKESAAPSIPEGFSF